VFSVAEDEAAKTGNERTNELLRSGRLVFLQTVGYTEAEILGLGDLAMVPSDKVSELLRRKTLEAAGRWQIVKEGVGIKPFKHKKRNKTKKRNAR
jgi:hypothetical protein